MALDYTITWNGTPFVEDAARVVRLLPAGMPDDPQRPPRKHQPLLNLIEEIDRLIPFNYLKDFGVRSDPGPNLNAVALRPASESIPVKIGDWYYPTTASRWSVFRGLATNKMVRRMIPHQSDSVPAKTFVMKVNPIAPYHADAAVSNYTLSTKMYALPPRPLAEHGAAFDGLWLVTLVDDRYYFQGTPVSLTVTKDTTWGGLISQLATALGAAVALGSAIPAAYGQPEPDSQLWARLESAPLLLDAVAANIGRVVVRKLDGTYVLYSPADSLAVVDANRGRSQNVARLAGGAIFNSGSPTAAGDLNKARNAVVPARVNVAFPKYVTGDPVPHFLNSRYANQRPSAWHEAGHGDLFREVVPIASGGSLDSSGVQKPLASGGALTSGVAGVSDLTIHTTAKALYATEAAASGQPTNASGLRALAMQIATDQWNGQLAAALDEVYPGTFKWAPEGIHDVVWTWSSDRRLASTRIMKTSWNVSASRMQHAAPPLANQTTVPKGVGGRSVPQTIRDSYSGGVSTNLAATFLSGDSSATLTSVANLPTQNRWRGQIDNEVILFEGTSGGAAVDVVYRGIDGTIQTQHDNQSTVAMLTPNVAYGVNLTTFEKGQFVFPSEWSSGGIAGVALVPQEQSVIVFSSGRATINAVDSYSGAVQLGDATKTSGQHWPQQELIWVQERNGLPLQSGKRYPGQLIGFSASGPVAPIYAVTEYPAIGGVGGSGSPGGLTPGCGISFSGNLINVDTKVSTSVTLNSPTNFQLLMDPLCNILAIQSYTPYTFGLDACGVVVKITAGTPGIFADTVNPCECDCSPPARSGSGPSGSGSGSGCVTVCQCQYCPAGAPCVWIATHPADDPWGDGVDDTCAIFDSLSTVALFYDSDCLWTTSYDADHWAELRHDDLGWLLVFHMEGGGVAVYRLASPNADFDCCGVNLFALDVLATHTDCHVPSSFTLTPDPLSPCGPCNPPPPFCVTVCECITCPAGAPCQFLVQLAIPLNNRWRDVSGSSCKFEKFNTDIVLNYQPPSPTTPNNGCVWFAPVEGGVTLTTDGVNWFLTFIDRNNHVVTYTVSVGAFNGCAIACAATTFTPPGLFSYPACLSAVPTLVVTAIPPCGPCGSTSGGSGNACTTVCDCSCCPNGAPCKWTARGFPNTGTPPDLYWVGGCKWQSSGFPNWTLTCDGTTWMLTDNGGFTGFVSVADYLCCGPNTFHDVNNPNLIAELFTTSACGPCSGGGGGPPYTNDCCPAAVGASLVATATGSTGSCGCLEGTYTLAYVGANTWTFTGTICGQPGSNLSLTCNVDPVNPSCADWSLDFVLPIGSQCVGSAKGNDGCTCGPPLNIVFDMTVSGCCIGSVRFTITPA